MIFGNFIYSHCIGRLVAFNAQEFFNALKELEIQKHKGYWVGYIKYEAWKFWQNEPYTSHKPLLFFECFMQRKPFVLLDMQYFSFYPKVIKTQSFSHYKKHIRSIKHAIKRGDSYQLNYTYPIILQTHCDLKNIFFEVLCNQNTPYKAFIQNEYESILSFSPELFFQKEANKLITQPMKGTIQRSLDSKQDKKQKAFLQNDRKNKSENVMIVDLLRNDLSKIAQKVEVSKLFEVISLPTLFQMISEIKANLKANVKIEDIFHALFPCGSITGAPKLKTMQIIETLEKYHRGIYCGAIGVIHQENMCFSVPIRTIYKDAKEEHLSLCVGSGIVWDSDTKEEYLESVLKSQFIYPKKDFSLIETMLVKNGKIKNFALHKKRLFNSVAYFGFKKPKLDNLKIQKDGILRLLVNKDGEWIQENLTLNPIVNTKIALALEPLNTKNDFFYHKTTYAPWYAKAREEVKKAEIFDWIFYNQSGELTEGARSNLVLLLDGKYYTPSLKSGLLNGIMRQKLLANKQIIEKTLWIEDLKNAQKIFCINAIRGMLEVHL